MAESTSILGGYFWLGLAAVIITVAFLYGFTRHVSRTLAWSLVGIGLTSSVVVYHATSVVAGSLCSEDIRYSGQSNDAQYSYVIQVQECGRAEGPTHIVKIGRNKDFMQMHKVFESVGDNQPQAVVQSRPHEFMITMAPKSGWDQAPLIVRLDPATGFPAEPIRYAAH